MCLIIFDWQKGENTSLTLLANRDEFFARPTRNAHHWDDPEGILAGRDLEAGGTWLGTTHKGRVCAVTNYREVPAKSGPKSRGEIPLSFLNSSDSALHFSKKLHENRTDFSGYNAILFDGEQLVYCSNRYEQGYQILDSGQYGLSNHLIDTPWPKLQRAKQHFSEALSQFEQPDAAASSLLDIMLDTHQPPDHTLPDTGVGLETERLLSSIFIRSPVYGTRATTLVHTSQDRVSFVERAFEAPKSEIETDVPRYQQKAFNFYF